MPMPVLKAPVSKDDVLLDTPAAASLIAKTRKSLNISQKALAIEMGISQPFLADLEAAHRRWSLKRFECAREALERLEKEKR